MKLDHKAFWNAFFYLFGFSSNPLRDKAKYIASKNVNDRISDSWKSTATNFHNIYSKEACIMHE